MCDIREAAGFGEAGDFRGDEKDAKFARRHAIRFMRKERCDPINLG